MAKVLRTVALVAGAVAILATGGAALAGGGLFLGVSVGTFGAIASMPSDPSQVAFILKGNPP